MENKTLTIKGNPLEVQAIIKSLIWRFGKDTTLESVLIKYQMEHLTFV